MQPKKDAARDGMQSLAQILMRSELYHMFKFQRHPTTYAFHPTTGYSDPFNLKNEERNKMVIADVLGSKYSEFDKSVYRSLKLEEKLSSEFCLIGRCSTVFKVSAPEGEHRSTMAIKLSWHDSSCPHEIENIQDARKLLKDRNVVEDYGYAGLEGHSPGETLQKLYIKKEQYKERRHRMLVLKYCHTLSEVEDSAKFRKLIIQLVESLHLLSLGGTFHRDISVGNLVYEETYRKLSIIVLDYELSVKTDHNSNGTNSIRTGTVPFMARDVLNGFETNYTHGINHDFESVFYFIVWHALGYTSRGSRLPEGKDLLRLWRKGGYKNMLLAKDEFFRDWESIRREFTDVSLEMWVARLHLKYGLVDSGVAQTLTDNRAQTARAKDAIMETLTERMIKEGFPESTLKTLYDEEVLALQEANNRKNRPLGTTISFKTFMKASLAPIGAEHNVCSCCGQ